MASVLLGGVSVIIMLLGKYPSSRRLGMLVLGYLLALILKKGQLEALYPLIPPMVAVGFYQYIRAFFLQKRRKVVVHDLLLLATFIFLLYGRTPITLNWILSVIVTVVYTAAALRLMWMEANLKGIDYFANAGSRISWIRTFSMVHFASLGAIATNPSDWVFGFILMLIIALVLYQLIGESSFFEPIPLGTKYQKSTLTPQIKAAVLGKIEGVMEEEFFLRDDASLTNLSKELGVTTHHLSQVLNESLKISFQDLIARYRIRRACHILRDEQHDQVKIEGVAAMVGYNSKSSFNTAFKRRTGLTPSEYRSAKNVRPYGEERLSERKVPGATTSWFHLSHVFNIKKQSDMIQHFLKVFGRNVKRNGLFSILNLVGLSVGFTCSILIYLFIQDELSYDRDLPDHERVHRIAWMNDNPQTRTPHPMAQAMVADLPGVQAAVSISPWYGPGLSKELVRVHNVAKDILFEEPDFFFADSTFLDVFPLKILEGDPDAFKKPFALILTAPMAQKYFGDSSAIGKELLINDMPIAVTAVLEPMPEKMHFHFNAIVPYITLKQINPNDSWLTWADFGHFNYVKLRPGVLAEEVEAKIPEWVSGYLNWSEPSLQRLLSGEINFALQPITSIHLNSHLRWELENNGNVLYIYILTATLCFLILIAAINYVNLTTAKSIERAREVGVRKTLGALSGGLSIQFYMESILFSLAAFALSLACASVLLESFNYLSGKQFEINDLFQLTFLVKAVMATLLIGLFAGFYPALVMASFRPVEVLKGKLSASFKGVRLRSVLVIVQFGISAILISGSFIIYEQISYMKEKDLGFDQEAVIAMSIPVSIEHGGIDLSAVRAVQQQINEISGVSNVSMLSNLPGGQFNQHAYYVKEDPESRVDASELMVDYGFEEVLGIEVVAGRAFNQSFKTDSLRAFMINQTAADLLNLEEPVGKKLVWVGNNEEWEGTIVGVLDDFHYRSLHETIQPLVITAQPLGGGHLIVKLEGRQFAGIMAQIEVIYEQLRSELPFEYQFLDDQLADLYNQEEQTLSIFSIFSVIALILASLGLLGMAIAIINQRIKEVGMRKILGASNTQIMGMIMGQFARLIFVAMVVGLPISYLMMQNWVQEFSYQAPFGMLPFVLAALVLILVAMMSILSAIMKITFSNPVDTLRYE